MSIFVKIRPAGAELFQADGRTDMTKLIVSFCSFANAPKNVRSEGKLGHVCKVCVCV
jgi:hypothetical protein